MKSSLNHLQLLNNNLPVLCVSIFIPILRAYLVFIVLILNEISITSKVIIIREAQVVSDRKLNKQDRTVADSSGTCRIVLWEEHIGKLKNMVSYDLQNMMVRQFNNLKYLVFNEQTIVKECEDIGEVSKEKDSCSGITVIKKEIIAVLSCDVYILVV